MKHRFHVVSLPHTQTTKDYTMCAYTNKVRLFSKMMHERGHEIILYSSQDNDAPCTEHVNVISKQDQKMLFGDYDWKSEFFKIEWKGNEPYWQLMNENAAKKINKRKKHKDFVLLVAGYCQKPISDKVGNGVLVVEPFVGYTGTFCNFRVFESYSHMHLCYGIWGGNSYDGKFYDGVVPGYYDPNDFPVYKDTKDYLLYVGRLVKRKGLEVAIETARATKRKLIIAGQGGKKTPEGLVIDGSTYTDDNLEYIGSVGVEERAKLMGEAHAVLTPTLYVEPFGNVGAETLMAGTPLISTDWGAFTDYNVDGLTGYRCRTLKEFVKAVDNVSNLDRDKIRRYARSKFSLEVVGKQFEQYFDRLYDLWDKGWYQD